MFPNIQMTLTTLIIYLFSVIFMNYIITLLFKGNVIYRIFLASILSGGLIFVIEIFIARFFYHSNSLYQSNWLMILIGILIVLGSYFWQSKIKSVP